MCYVNITLVCVCVCVCVCVFISGSVIYTIVHLCRSGGSYRSAPHLLAYNPAEKAILLCSVCLYLLSTVIIFACIGLHACV